MMDCWSLAGSLSLNLEALKRCSALATLSHLATLLYSFESALQPHDGVRHLSFYALHIILHETPQELRP
jgi:hypothetical protein